MQRCRWKHFAVCSLRCLASTHRRFSTAGYYTGKFIVFSWGRLRRGDLPGRMGMDAKLLHDALRHASLPVVREDELGTRFAEAARPPKDS